MARLLCNASEAKEVAHDAYLRVYPTVQRDAAEKPEARLYTTARRLTINRIKHRTHRADRLALVTFGAPRTLA